MQYGYNYLIINILFKYKYTDKKFRLAKLLILTSFLGPTALSPLKDAMMNTSSFLRVELSILIGEKKACT